MPVAPEAVVVLEITGGGTLTVNVRVFVPEPLPLVAPMVTEYVPAVVGVPVIAPVLELYESPLGRLVTL